MLDLEWSKKTRILRETMIIFSITWKTEKKIKTDFCR